MTASKPKQIQYACYLLWICLILSFILRAVDADSLDSRFVTDLFSDGGTYFLVVALYAYLFVGISKGRNSARFLILALFLLRLLLIPPSVSGIVEAPISGTIEVIQIGLQILALFLIFTVPGKSWFVTRNVTNKPIESTNSSLELLKAIEGKKQTRG